MVDFNFVVSSDRSPDAADETLREQSEEIKEMSYGPTLLINAKRCRTSPEQAETIVLKPRSSFIIELNAFISSSVYLNYQIQVRIDELRPMNHVLVIIGVQILSFFLRKPCIKNTGKVQKRVY